MTASQKKVGKILAREYYIHRDAINRQEYIPKFNAKILELYYSALTTIGSLERDFTFDFVAILPKDQCVRLLKMSSLSEPHPHVIDSRKIFLKDNSVVHGKITGNLYHRLDLIISPSHPAYEFHQAVTIFEEENGLLDAPVPYHPKKWFDKINESLGFEKYNSKINEMKGLIK